MTNTKFRKRALLSSVAMLLVALVALGSATFAWFVANPTVTASGLVMKTTASPGLTVASASAKAVSAENAFGYTTILDARTYSEGVFAGPAANAQDSMLLDPASFDTSVTPVVTTGTGFTVGKIEAKDSGAAAKADGAFGTCSFYSYYVGNGSSGAGGDGVYYEDVFVKTSANAASTDTVDVHAIKVTMTQANANNDNIATGVRVAVADNTGKLLGVWAPANAKGTKCFDSTKSDGSTKTASYKTSGDTLKSSTAIMTASNSTTANFFRVYVYLDGEDTNVYTDNVTTNITAVLSNLEIKISTKNEDL